VPQSQDCHVLQEVLHVHAGQQVIIILMLDCGQECSDGTTGIPRHLRKTHKESKGAMSFQLPLHYIHGDNRYRRQIEETKAEYFPISREGNVFTAWECLPLPNPA
jgi:hypothetical protein